MIRHLDYVGGCGCVAIQTSRDMYGPQRRIQPCFHEPIDMPYVCQEVLNVGRDELRPKHISGFVSTVPEHTG